MVAILSCLLSPSNIKDLVYRRVLLQGRWHHEKSVVMGPRKYETLNGYHLVTPLESTALAESNAVLVNRGFVSTETAVSIQEGQGASSSQQVDQPTGLVQVLGILAPAFQKSIFTPDNDPQKGQWIWPDVRAIANWAGDENLQIEPVMIDEIFGKVPL